MPCKRLFLLSFLITSHFFMQRPTSCLAGSRKVTGFQRRIKDLQARRIARQQWRARIETIKHWSISAVAVASLASNGGRGLKRLQGWV